MRRLNRRGFIRRSLQSGTSAAAIGSIAQSALSAPADQEAVGGVSARAKAPRDRSDIAEHFRGPIPSLNTPFRRDGSVDYDALRKLIDAQIAGGTKAILLTAGDSHYFCLSDEEIAEVTRATCRHVAGRAMVIAADRQYSTARAVQFARFARGQGADVLMCMPPDWGASCTTDTLVEHYATVAREMSVMIVTNVFISRGMEFGLKTVDLALKRSPNIVAIKDDMVGEFGRRLAMLVRDRCKLMSGGTKQNHFDVWPYGCDCYLSTLATIAPRIAHDYWSALEKKDLETAQRIIKEIEVPFFDYIMKLPGGFDAGIHGVLELYGLAPRWRRKPYYSLSDAEMRQLKEFLATLKIPQPA